VISDNATTGRTVLLRGGSVHTPADPFATAMLVDGDSVAWVGQEGAAEAHADGVDEVVHLEGALVTPAFVDAHVHTTATGLALTGLDLSACASLVEALDAVERHARARRGGVVLGHGWDETRWPERRPPTRRELDRASYGGVVYLSRVDSHSAVVSSALVAATPGVVELPGWSADGPLTRDAHHVVRRVARAALTPSQRSDAQRAALHRAAEVGIGVVHEIGGPEIAGAEDFAGVLELARTEVLPEVVGYWGELGAVDAARELGAHGLAGDLFADGSIGSHTAALAEPYADVDMCGHRYLSAGEVRDHVVTCTRAGLQAGFHAIGDAAIAAVLDGFAAAAAQLGDQALRSARHRIEHAEMLWPEAIERLARWSVVASVQPAFDALWGGDSGMYATRLGPERALTLNPFASMLAAGVPLAFGSDAPVTPLDPWGAVRAAAQHHVPDQRMTVRAAFAAHTRGGWRAAGYDGAGVLIPGAPASYAVWQTGELVVQTPDERIAAWSTDPRAGVPGLPDLSPGAPLPTCLQTVVRGRTVFSLEQRADAELATRRRSATEDKEGAAP
jgi:predicted amidohydrolase YtcJ